MTAAAAAAAPVPAAPAFPPWMFTMSDQDQATVGTSKLLCPPQCVDTKACHSMMIVSQRLAMLSLVAAGSLPTNMSSYEAMTLFDVSGNQLEGEMPKGAC